MVVFIQEKTRDQTFDTRAQAEDWLEEEKFKLRQAGYSVKTSVKFDRSSNEWEATIQIGLTDKELEQ